MGLLMRVQISGTAACDEQTSSSVIPPPISSHHALFSISICLCLCLSRFLSLTLYLGLCFYVSSPTPIANILLLFLIHRFLCLSFYHPLSFCHSFFFLSPPPSLRLSLISYFLYSILKSNIF